MALSAFAALGIASCSTRTHEVCVTSTSSPIVGAWSATPASLSVARSQFSQTGLAIHLSNGNILIPGGGTGGGAVAATDVYQNGAFITAMNLPMARTHAAAIALDNGAALYASGAATTGPTTIADRFNSGSNDWPYLGITQVARTAPGTARLPDGKVLIAGGGTNSAEVFNPTNSQFALTGALSVPRSGPLAAVLPSGKVAIIGGVGSAAPIEVFDATSGVFTSGPNHGPGSLTQATAALLPDGKILYCGGCGAPSTCTTPSLAACYTFDGATVSPTGALTQGRGSHNMITLPTNRVLIVGGITSGSPIGSAAEYDPTSGQWTSTGGLLTARYDATIALLPNGQVLIAGGRTSASSMLASTEIYDPGTPVVCKVRQPDGTWATLANGTACTAGTCQAGVCAPLPGSDAGAASDGAADTGPPPPPLDAGIDAAVIPPLDAGIDAPTDAKSDADANAPADAAPDASTDTDAGADAATDSGAGSRDASCTTTETKEGCSCSTVPSPTTPRSTFALAAFAALCLARRKHRSKL